jgi:hypothetical protein
MDDRCIDLIITATRAAPGAAKLQCSRFEDNAFGCVRAKRALGDDIESSVTVCKAADCIRSRSRGTKHQKTLNRLDKALNKAQAVLDADPKTTTEIMMSSVRSFDLPGALASGRSFVAQAQERLSRTSGFEGETHTFIVSLVRRLKVVFKDHFGAKPGYTKKDNEDDPHGPAILDSPFIRFTEQVFAEFKVTKSNGKPYSRAAIADAIRKANKL